MKIKLLIGRAGIDFSNNPGDIIDVPDSEAAAMIEAGQAEAVSKSPKKRAAKAAPKDES
jgi:hypothetical protein